MSALDCPVPTCAYSFDTEGERGAHVVAFHPDLFECDCCERLNVPRKLKGIGYVCDDCLLAYAGWDDSVDPHLPCPFKLTHTGRSDE